MNPKQRWLAEHPDSPQAQRLVSLALDPDAKLTRAQADLLDGSGLRDIYGIPANAGNIGGSSSSAGPLIGLLLAAYAARELL